MWIYMKDPNFAIAFTIGKYTIYWYAVLLALGIVAALVIVDRRARGRALPKDIALDLCILGVPFGVLGARLFACLSGAVKWSNFFDLTRSGLSFFGGMILAGLAMLVYLKLRKADVGEMLDAAAPAVFVGIGVAVWGDFFNRSNYGPLVENPSLKWFPLATFGDDLKVHYAAFFYEFLLCLALVVIYYALLRRVIRRKGDRFLWMALIYCLGRFAIDSIRQGLVKVGPLAFDQICELVLAVLFLCALLLKRPAQKAEEGPKPESEKPAEEEPEPPAPAESADPAPAAEPEAAPEEPQPDPKAECTGLD